MIMPRFDISNSHGKRAVFPDVIYYTASRTPTLASVSSPVGQRHIVRQLEDIRPNRANCLLISGAMSSLRAAVAAAPVDDMHNVRSYQTVDPGWKLTCSKSDGLHPAWAFEQVECQ